MSRVVCEHLIPENQRCPECDAEASKWHPDVKRILDLEAERDRYRDALKKIHAALMDDRYGPEEITSIAMIETDRALGFDA